MIARHWRGLAKPEFASAYIEHLRQQTFPALRSLHGFKGLSIRRRRYDIGTEFLVISEWESEEAIAAFAGTDIERAVVPDAVRRMMVEFDTRARHYEVIE